MRINPVATIDCDQYYAASDSIKLAKFYAAANPATVLDLLSQIEELQGALKDIGDFAHDRSAEPAVDDDLWEVRRMARLYATGRLARNVMHGA